MFVYELIEALDKMPRGVTVEFLVDGQILKGERAGVGLILRPDGYTVVRVLLWSDDAIPFKKEQ
jgi:hypothetical protein